MSPKTLSCLMLSGCLILSAATPSAAGKLGDFEKEATKQQGQGRKKKGKKAKKSLPEKGGKETDSSSVFWDLLGIFFLGGGAASIARIHARDSDKSSLLTKREIGEPAIPFLRLDLNYQDVKTDVRNFDGRVEVGYGPVGVQFRKSQFFERDPRTFLNIVQIHGLYRMSITKYFEWDFGFGSTSITGVNKNSGFSFTMPMQIFFTKNIAVSFRPAWATVNKNPVRDLDLGLLLSHGAVSVHSGYRWVDSDSSSLDGPFVGTSMRF